MPTIQKPISTLRILTDNNKKILLKGYKMNTSMMFMDKKMKASMMFMDKKKPNQTTMSIFHAFRVG